MMLVALSIVLGALTVFVSPVAALAVVCGLLWFALYRSARALQQERAKVDSYLMNIRDKYDSIIGVLCGAMNLKDDIKSLHTSRVAHLASTVATELGMRRDEIRLLQKAAVLADIGKIEIAETILTKPGDLDGHEWEEMRRHPELGYRILSGISHLRDAGDIVLAHHERFDGQGYPRNLKGEEIPLAARILSVVDAYTAMTSDRPHRRKMTHEVALKEILRNSLTQFDPEVVRAFVRCEERGMVIQADPATEEGPVSVAVRVAGAA
jgi:HD-GYP domain-containing protein (c-di-GMP phosphodiesterase class II)